MRTISFIIPVYNEEKRIGKTIKALLGGVSFPGLKLEKLIFVDDGSKDNTKFEIKNSKSKIEKKLKAKIKIISYRKNRGKGYAIKQGMLASKSDYTLMFDADMSTSISELKKFLPFMKKGVDVIIGTRKNGHSTVVKHQPLYREILGRGFTLLSNVILDTWVTDFTCGFKAFSKFAKDRIFENTIVDRWSYDAEILYLAKKMNLIIQEKAVIWKNDPGTKVNLMKDLPETLTDLVKIRFYDYNLLVSFSKEPALI
ncbi:MAG: glycosyltransferase [Patescibacteria group bacterium]